MRSFLLAIVLTAIVGAVLPGAASAASRDCGTFRVTSHTGAHAHVRARIYSGSISCGTARQVLRYSLTHPPEGRALGSPGSWVCARGGPDIFPTAAGYSCEARHPRRIVTGRFLY